MPCKSKRIIYLILKKRVMALGEYGKLHPALEEVYHDLTVEFFSQHLEGMLQTYVTLYDHKVSKFIYYKPNWFMFANIMNSVNQDVINFENSEVSKIDPFMRNKVETVDVKFKGMDEHPKTAAQVYVHTNAFTYRDQFKIREFLERKFARYGYADVFVFENFDEDGIRELRKEEGNFPITPLDEASRLEGFLNIYLSPPGKLMLVPDKKIGIDGRILSVWERKDANTKLC
jgi:hypothetical protein